MISQYKKQTDEIAKKLGCIITEDHNIDGMMYVEEEPPRIEAPILNIYKSAKYPGGLQTKYMVRLHELGHVFYGHTQGRAPYEHKTFYFDNGILYSEAQAWDYAMNNCIDDKLDEETLSFIRNCLMSYILAGRKYHGKKTTIPQRNSHIEFIFDIPNQFVISTYKRMGGNEYDILLYEYPTLECNHSHEDALQVALPSKKAFPTVIACMEFKDKRIWTKKELALERQRLVKKFVPILLKERKGRQLLRKHLNKKQLRDYNKYGYFFVTKNKKRYKIHGYYGVEHKQSKTVTNHFCLHGTSNELPQSDVLLIQKIMIEHNFEEFYKKANKSKSYTIDLKHVVDDNSPVTLIPYEGTFDRENIEKKYI